MLIYLQNQIFILGDITAVSIVSEKAGQASASDSEKSGETKNTDEYETNASVESFDASNGAILTTDEAKKKKFKTYWSRSLSFFKWLLLTIADFNNPVF